MCHSSTRTAKVQINTDRSSEIQNVRLHVVTILHLQLRLYLNGVIPYGPLLNKYSVLTVLLRELSLANFFLILSLGR